LADESLGNAARARWNNFIALGLSTSAGNAGNRSPLHVDLTNTGGALVEIFVNENLVPLEEITSLEGKMASRALIRPHVGVGENVSVQLFGAGKLLAAVGTVDHVCFWCVVKKRIERELNMQRANIGCNCQ
jgi:hypothetical protein